MRVEVFEKKITLIKKLFFLIFSLFLPNIIFYWIINYGEFIEQLFVILSIGLIDLMFILILFSFIKKMLKNTPLIIFQDKNLIIKTIFCSFVINYKMIEQVFVNQQQKTIILELRRDINRVSFWFWLFYFSKYKIDLKNISITDLKNIFIIFKNNKTEIVNKFDYL